LVIPAGDRFFMDMFSGVPLVALTAYQSALARPFQKCFLIRYIGKSWREWILQKQKTASGFSTFTLFETIRLPKKRVRKLFAGSGNDTGPG